jgi:Fic family protein
LLITLLLCAWGFLNHPILYISYYLKLNRQQYYDVLQTVRATGKWEEWIQFFLQGIIDSAEEECNATKRLLAVIKKDIDQIENLGKGAGSIKQVFEFMKRHPIIGISDISASLEMSPHTVTKALGRMTDLGIVQEITGKKRGKLFTYHKYLDVLSEGGEPL